MGNEQPYLSVVVTGRNDNYGGDFYARLQNMVLWTAAQLEAHEIPSELIVVNYNYIAEREDLREAIQWPEDGKFCTTRILYIPPEEHEKLVNDRIRKTVPLFEFIAKNIGIRRAEGEYILCTNADIIFHPGLFAEIAKRQLDREHFYRADRLDYIDEAIYQPGEAVDAFVSKLNSSVSKYFLQGGTFPKRPFLPRKLQESLQLAYNGLRKWYYNGPGSSWLALNLPLVPCVRKREVFMFNYHCNASGDFFLMHRDNWMRIKGYMEDTWISTHVDSLITMSAVYSGLKQHLYADPVYHREHERRYVFDGRDPNMDRMYRRLVFDVLWMETHDKALINIFEDWGLGNTQFKEKRIPE